MKNSRGGTKSNLQKFIACRNIPLIFLVYLTPFFSENTLIQKLTSQQLTGEQLLTEIKSFVNLLDMNTEIRSMKAQPLWIVTISKELLYKLSFWQRKDEPTLYLLSDGVSHKLSAAISSPKCSLTAPFLSRTLATELRSTWSCNDTLKLILKTRNCLINTLLATSRVV